MNTATTATTATITTPRNLYQADAALEQQQQQQQQQQRPMPIDTYTMHPSSGALFDQATPSTVVHTSRDYAAYE
jgi:hypothetical protein